MLAALRAARHPLARKTLARHAKIPIGSLHSVLLRLTKRGVVRHHNREYTLAQPSAAGSAMTPVWTGKKDDPSLQGARFAPGT